MENLQINLLTPFYAVMQRNISLIIFKQRYFNYEKNNVKRLIIVRDTGYKSNFVFSNC